MMTFNFDAELTGVDGETLEVHCEIQAPSIGGQRSLINIAIPTQSITDEPPRSPCLISGKSGLFTVNMQGVHWRRFPTSAKSRLGLATIELLHVDRLIIQKPSKKTDKRQIRFHLAPISYLRSESDFCLFNSSSNSEELFALTLPHIGSTSFVVEWETVYHRDTAILGATVNAGFSAIADLPLHEEISIDDVVEKFQRSLGILSVLFRQAVTLYGWTYALDSQIVSTWIAPLAPNVTQSGHEERGEFIVRQQDFVDYATHLTHSYDKVDEKTRSLVRHISLAINPHNNLRAEDRFLFMFSAFERVIESAWKQDKLPSGLASTTPALIKHLEGLKQTIAAENTEDSLFISERIKGLINIVNRPSIHDKLTAFFRVYSAMNFYCRDLWPISGTEKERGLREIRHALAHGSGSFLSHDVVAVAGWHLAILLERLIFVLLAIDMPIGISPNSYLLQMGGKGWYERDWWQPLRCKQSSPI